jgi:hypothetical protein
LEKQVDQKTQKAQSDKHKITKDYKDLNDKAFEKSFCLLIQNYKKMQKEKGPTK